MESLSRANDNLTGKYLLQEDIESFVAHIQLREKLPKESKTFAAAYIKDYLDACGFTVLKVLFPDYRIQISYLPHLTVRNPASPGKPSEALAGQAQRRNRGRRTTS